MADVKISQLPQASLPLTGAEVFPVVQNGVTVQAPIRSIGSTANIAALRAATPVSGIVTNVEGYYSTNDGGGGVFYGVSGVAPGTYVDNGGTIILPSNGDGSTAWLRAIDAIISARMFGAISDTNIDSTIFIQKALDVALSLKLSLLLDGKFKITASLILNRRVTTTSDIFVIFAEGTGNGLYVDTSITMFDSTLPFGGINPVSEFITFRGVHFQGIEANANTYVLNKKFLRMRFENCNFRGIKCLTSDTYVQTYYFDSCNIREWGNGIFFDSTGGAYDFSVSTCVVEAARGGFVRLTDVNNIRLISGVRFNDNLIEGIPNGSAIALGGTRGCTIIGNYFEYVGGANIPVINLDLNTIIHIGVLISGNFCQNPDTVDWWMIKWGRCQTAESSNNYCNARLHDNSTIYLASGSPTVSSIGDYSLLQFVASTYLWKIPRGNILCNTVAYPLQNITQAGGVFPIAAETYSIFKLTTSVAVGNSCSFPTGGVLGQRISIQFVNNTGVIINNWTFTGSWVVSWTALAIGKYRSIDFYYDGASWRALSITDVG
jgi:hypothetical protein